MDLIPPRLHSRHSSAVASPRKDVEAGTISLRVGRLLQRLVRPLPSLRSNSRPVPGESSWDSRGDRRPGPLPPPGMRPLFDSGLVVVDGRLLVALAPLTQVVQLDLDHAVGLSGKVLV